MRFVPFLERARRESGSSLRGPGALRGPRPCTIACLGVVVGAVAALHGAPRDGRSAAGSRPEGVAGTGPRSTVAAYADGAPAAHTGGFGEPTCRECHFDHEADAPGGALQLLGFPRSYRADSVYNLEVRLTRSGLVRAGFQLAVRFAGGGRAGRSAGRLLVEGDRVQRVGGGPDSVDYVSHTVEGSRPATSDTARWQVAWRAPEEPSDKVRLNVAANAANGDDSEFGDYIYLLECGSGPESAAATVAERRVRP